MTKFLKTALTAIAGMAMLATISPASARRGADDAPGDVRQCRGCDDAPGHIRQSRGADDAPGDIRRSRGTDDAPGTRRDRDRDRDRGRSSDDPMGHQ